MSSDMWCMCALVLYLKYVGPSTKESVVRNARFAADATLGTALHDLHREEFGPKEI